MDYRLVAAELAADVKSRDAIIADHEKQLIDEKREHAKTKLQVQAIKQDKWRIEHNLRAEIYNLRQPAIPHGDLKRGYRCDCEGAIDYPFEQDYCMYCGAQFDWNSRPQEDDEWALDRLRDERLGGY